jgi:hypothetical protein
MTNMKLRTPKDPSDAKKIYNKTTPNKLARDMCDG